jgi:protein phosphatase
VEIDAEQRQKALDLARRLLAIEATSFPPVERSRKVSMPKLKAASRTEIGRVRDNNEDAVVSSDRLAVVADGMGGHPGGEVASAVAVSLVQAAYTGRSLDELQAAVRAANRVIWDRAGGNAELEGMGTTICAAGLTDDGSLAVVNVGDSRAYVLRDGSLRQLTHDHSLTAELVLRGELSEREALDHPLRGVLTRALGVGPDVEADSATHRATAGDRLLLCSDGLVNEVPNDEIASVMAATEDVQATADASSNWPCPGAVVTTSPSWSPRSARERGAKRRAAAEVGHGQTRHLSRADGDGACGATDTEQWREFPEVGGDSDQEPPQPPLKVAQGRPPHDACTTPV